MSSIDFKTLHEVIDVLDTHYPEWYKKIQLDKIEPMATGLFSKCNCAVCLGVERWSGDYLETTDVNKVVTAEYLPYWKDAIRIRQHPERDLTPKKGSIVMYAGGTVTVPYVDTDIAEELNSADRKGWEEGYKADDDKIHTDLMVPQALLGLSEVLTFGAKKYAPRNWEKGILFSRVYGAALRHLFAWWSGEDLDPETGLSHVDHAACCLHFLSTYIKDTAKYQKFDDRGKGD